VLFEDAADVLGLVVAFLGVYLGHALQNPFYDGVASIIIGVILTFIAWILARESRSLLLGEALSRTTLDKIVAQFLSAGIVEKVDRPLSIYLGPEDVVVVLGASFKEDVETGRLQDEIRRLKIEIQTAFPVIKRIFIEPRPEGH
jgi:divalent metal cation (Fe/Co/Zn/Cd) transporter